MKIGIIGAGYVGLTTGICLASLGHKVNIYDIDNQKLTKIMDKKLPFFEKGLGEMLEVVVSSGDLIPKDDLDSLVEHTDGCFICVGTPTKNNSIDLILTDPPYIISKETCMNKHYNDVKNAMSENKYQETDNTTKSEETMTDD